MVELDRILSERSDDRILSSIHALSNSGFTRLVERILGYLGLSTTRKRDRGDFIIADCVHRPDDTNYVVFFSRRDEAVTKQAVDSLVSYMERANAPKGLVLSSSSIMPDAVSMAEAHDVGVADGPKLAALVRRFDLDRDLLLEADMSKRRASELAEAGHIDESVADRMAEGYEALAAKDYLSALESAAMTRISASWPRP